MQFAWNTTPGLMAVTACSAVVLVPYLASGEADGSSLPLGLVLIGASTAGVAAIRAVESIHRRRRDGEPMTARFGATIILESVGVATLIVGLADLAFLLGYAFLAGGAPLFWFAPMARDEYLVPGGVMAGGFAGLAVARLCAGRSGVPPAAHVDSWGLTHAIPFRARMFPISRPADVTGSCPSSRLIRFTLQRIRSSKRAVSPWAVRPGSLYNAGDTLGGRPDPSRIRAMAVSPSVDRLAKLAAPRNPTPLLVDGDHLTRDEFERRYDAMPGLKKAELIEGVVHMPSPVRYFRHSDPHSSLVGWMWVYRAGTPGVGSGDNGSIRLDLSNMPQPDGFLIVMPEHGGRVRISEDDYIEGGPELVGEVAASSASYDLGEKQGAYLRNGVLEYIVWRVLDRAVNWFVLRDDRYERLEPGADGILRSVVFPGLWLDAAALSGGDSARVLAVLQQGIGSDEHAGFVAQLNARAPQRA